MKKNGPNLEGCKQVKTAICHVAAFLLCLFCSKAQCMPGVDELGFCAKCASGVMRYDTVLPLSNGTFVARLGNQWFHSTNKGMRHFLSEDLTAQSYGVFTEQYSHYLNLRIGSHNRWFDTAASYRELNYPNVWVSDFGKSMYGRVGSVWLVANPSGTMVELKCDSIHDAAWPYAIVVTQGRFIVLRIPDSTVLLENIEEIRFVGSETVLLQTSKNGMAFTSQLFHLSTRTQIALQYDTVDIVGPRILAKESDGSVILDSLGDTVLRTDRGVEIMDCNNSRAVVLKADGEVALVNYKGVQLNSIRLQALFLGRHGFHIGIVRNERSICILNDDGDVVVPLGRYYPIRNSAGRELHDLSANGVLLVANESGQSILLQVTQERYRELHCGKK